MNFKSALYCGCIAIAAYAPLVPAYAQDGSAPPAPNTDSAPSSVGEIIVTAQKRAEKLQDVPIAVSAFSQKSLETRGLTGGSSLQQAIPNVVFQNASYNRFNFQIRGIGAQIQGQSVDTGVGIHENNVPLTATRLPDAEFFDMERVEVLRGPQGTLYGRNATGGVVNLITAKPTDHLEGELTGEYGRYDTRKFRGFLNVPLADNLAVRAAGTYIKRDGTTYNAGTGNHVDNRDLWSTRLTAAWEPSSSVKITAMWEHFEEDDTKGGGVKVNCAPDPGPASVGGVPTNPITQAILSNGCLATRPDSPANTGVASSLTNVVGVLGLASGLQGNPSQGFNAYAGKVVSTDLRTIDSGFDPAYSAKSDLLTFQAEFRPTDTITVTSLSSYNKDRFSAESVFIGGVPTIGFNPIPGLTTPTGAFTDPQLGTSNLMSAVQNTRQNSRQFTEEFRVQSDFDGPLNFSVGGIYLDYKQALRVLAFGNTVTAYAIEQNAGGAGIYIDPTPNGDETGHNYYLNTAPYRLRSIALFGEGYWKIANDVKLTVGLRYTNDLKTQVTYPVVLLKPGAGLPSTPTSRVRFQEPTGRVTLDWTPHIAFTDQSLFYASASRGYKGGGFNPGGLGGSANIPPTFQPEFVNAIEIGTKNTLLDRRLVLNLTGFYYKYDDYQVSKQVDLTIINENVGAKLYGLEFETQFEPIDRLRLNANVGYLHSEISSGSSVDQINPTQGDPALTAVFNSGGAQCVIPTAVAAGAQAAINAGAASPAAMLFLCTPAFGAIDGVPVNLRGKQLPAAPHWNVSLGAEYEMDFGSEWTGTVRADYYWQGASYARIYNDAADRVSAYDNLNLSYRVASKDKGVSILMYARNLLSSQAITSATYFSGRGWFVSGRERATYGIALTKSF